MPPSTSLVSIIVPCHNYAHTLIETLNSIRAQSLSNWETIIINDGSLDNTQDIIQQFSLLDSRFIGITQENKGVSAARNAGIKAARGDFLLFLDADDLITPQKLEAHIRHFETTPETDISYSHCQYFSTLKPKELYPSFDLTQREWMQKISSKGKTILATLMDRNLFVISSPVIRKASLPTNVNFKENIRYYEDWLFWLECAISDMNFQYCEEKDCATLIRVHPISTVQNEEKMFDGIPPFRAEIAKALHSAKDLSPTERNRLSKRNKRHLEKWCRKKLERSGVNRKALKEVLDKTNATLVTAALVKHLAKKPTYFLKTFLNPR